MKPREQLAALLLAPLLALPAAAGRSDDQASTLRRATLIVADAEASMRFYRDVIGMSVYLDTTGTVTPESLPSVAPPGSASRFIIMRGKHPWLGMIGLLQYGPAATPRDPNARLEPGDTVLMIETARTGDAGVRREFRDSRLGQVHLRRAAPPAVVSNLRAPVVLPHQTPLSGRMFASLLPELASDRVVYALDTPGYGESAAPPARPSFEEYGRAIGDVLLSIGEPVDLVGYHTGAGLAVQVAAIVAEKQRPGRQGDWAIKALAATDLAAQLRHLQVPGAFVRPRDGLWDATGRAAALRPDWPLIDRENWAYGMFDAEPAAVAALLRELLDERRPTAPVGRQAAP